MNPETIRITRLDPMRVASAYGFGAQPELTAWENLKNWAKPKGLLEDLEAHPIFGFNNPYPTGTSSKYGYVYWIKVGAEVEPEGNVRIEEFFGGTYAVQRCEVLGNPGRTVPSGWQSLAEWCKNNHHPLAHFPALERFLSLPDDLDHLVLMLHCPIVSQSGKSDA